MNTIRELKQQEKYKSMLKRKNKEKKIYKDKNASLQLEKQRLYIALRNKDEEIERLNNIINELSKEIFLREKIKVIQKEIGDVSNKETLRDMVLEYQEKIDKAIEYIEDNSDDMHTYISQVLTDILKGSDSNGRKSKSNFK